MGLFSDIKEKLKRAETLDEDFETPRDEYLELRTDEEIETSRQSIVKPFTLEDFEDIRNVIDSLREGNVIALINIRPLKEKDITELKRAVSKLRKTCDALNGEIAGFTEDIIIVTGSSARIHKTKEKQVTEYDE